jgi:hypothetical protein
MRAGLALLAYLCACLAPTEVKVEVQTDICELHRVAIDLGDSTTPVAAQPVNFDRLKCVASVALGKPFPVGTLVFVPSQPNAKFSFEVVGSIGNDCTMGQCVHAARSVAYVQHQALNLPVLLERACIDRMCPIGTTCRGGTCQPIELDAGAPIDASADVVADVIPDVTGDTGTVCLEPGADILSGTYPLKHSWSFDGNPIEELPNHTMSSLMNGNAIVVGPKGCGGALAFGMGVQSLGVTDASVGFGAAFYLFLQGAQSAKTTLLTKSYSSFGHFDVSIDATQHVVLAPCNQVTCGEIVTTSAVPAQTWTRIEILATSSNSITVWFDGTKVPLMTIMPTPSGAYLAGGLSLAPTGFLGATIDELRIFGIP